MTRLEEEGKNERKKENKRKRGDKEGVKANTMRR